MKNKQEFDRLCRLYPLFKLSIQEYEDKEILVAEQSIGSSFSTRLSPQGIITNEGAKLLDRCHMQKSINTELMKQYPDLHIAAYPNRNGIKISAWVKRADRDAEGIGSIGLLALNLRDTLQDWQDEAQKAKQEGWFFCSGHNKAEPNTEYGYFYFAGKYCKQYGIEHPEHKSMAGRERYN